MVQPHILLSLILFVVIISLNSNNTNAAVITVGQGFLNDINTDGLNRKLTPTKWLKRQVRQLNKAVARATLSIKENTDDIADFVGKVRKNSLDIGINAANITDNEEDVSDNAKAIDENNEQISRHSETIEDIRNSTLVMIADNTALLGNNTIAIVNNGYGIEANAKDIDHLEALYEIHNTTTTTPTTTNSPSNPCVDESLYKDQFEYTAQVIDGICYMFPQVKSKWTNAQTICQQQNGNLCNIRSKQQFDSLARFSYAVFGDDDSVWAGPNDMETEGVWKLSNGEPFELEEEGWVDIFSYGYQYQDCSVIKANYLSQYDYLEDQECFEERYFICEFLN